VEVSSRKMCVCSLVVLFTFTDYSAQAMKSSGRVENENTEVASK